MNKPNWANQTIWTGDCLDILRGMNSESVDLVYLDPPFNSKANYAAPIGSKAAGAAFKDTWTLSDVDVEWINLIEAKHPALYRVLLAAMTPSDKSYLAYMAARLLELRRVLKLTGSLYLHCDPTMSHYLKLVLDAIFGWRTFMNEICWKRSSAHSDTKQGMRRYGKIRDLLLVYTKSDDYTWNPIFTPYTAEYLESEYRHVASDGRRYKEADATAAKPGGDTKYDWPVKRPIEKKGVRWEPDLDEEFRQPRAGWEYRPVQPYKGRYWAYSKANLIQSWKEKHLVHRSTGAPRLMLFADDMPGIPLQDLWTDISPESGERDLGYPTQKPLALLDRIIQASSNKGDVVLDPFAGCATACIAAEQLHRNWIGIDISQKAAELVRARMRDELGLFYDGAHRTDVPQRTDLGPLPKHNCLENRQQLYGEQGGHCTGCGSHFEPRHLEVDHIVARAKGGTDHIDNLQLLCGNCNRIKGNRGMDYLKAKMQLG